MSSHLSNLITETKTLVVTMRLEVIAEAKLLEKEFWQEHHKKNLKKETKRGRGHFTFSVRDRYIGALPSLDLVWGWARVVKNKEGLWKPITKPINKGKGHRYPIRNFKKANSEEIEMINRYEDRAEKIREVSISIGKISSSLNRLLKKETSMAEALDNA